MRKSWLSMLKNEKSFPLSLLKYVKWRIFLTMATPRLMPCEISQNLIMSVNKQGVPRDYIPHLWLVVQPHSALLLARSLTNALEPRDICTPYLEKVRAVLVKWFNEQFRQSSALLTGGPWHWQLHPHHFLPFFRLVLGMLLRPSWF